MALACTFLKDLLGWLCCSLPLLTADSSKAQTGQNQYYSIGSGKIIILPSHFNSIDFHSKVKDFSTSLLEYPEIKNKIERLQKISENKIDNPFSQFVPSFSKTMTQPPSQPTGEPFADSSTFLPFLKKVSTKDLTFISLVIGILTILATLIGVGVALYTNLSDRIGRLESNIGNRIDNGLQEIREEAREDRKLIISANKDFNNRIDTTNQRIDRVYQAPSIKSS